MHQVCLNLREFSSGVQDHQGVGAVGGYGGGAASPHIRPRRGIQLIQRANLRGQECLELSSALGAARALLPATRKLHRAVGTKWPCWTSTHGLEWLGVSHITAARHQDWCMVRVVLPRADFRYDVGKVSSHSITLSANLTSEPHLASPCSRATDVVWGIAESLAKELPTRSRDARVSRKAPHA